MIKPAVMRSFAEAFKPYGFSEKAFNASYGLAENVLAVSFSDSNAGLLVDVIDKDALEDHRAVPAANETDGRAFVACGKILPGQRGEIRDENGVVLGERQVGRLFIAGDSVMKGYFNNPEGTAEAIKDGWLDTGDLAYWIGDELVIVGRAKEMLRVGGENVAPADIENVLQTHPAVSQAQVVGVPDARMLEVPAAYVVLNPGAGATEAASTALSRRPRARSTASMDMVAARKLPVWPTISPLA